MLPLKKVIALVATGALAVSMAVPAQADLSSFLDSVSLQKGDYLILTSEYGRDGQHSQLSLQPGSAAEGEKRGQWIQCASFDDEACQGNAALKRLTANPILPDCSKTTDEICVEYLKLGLVGQELTQAELVGENLWGTEFPAKPSVNLPQGSGLPLYENKSDLKIAETNSFAVMVRPQLFWDFTKKKMRNDRLEVKVIPFKWVPRSTKTLGCAFEPADRSKCAVLQDFAPDVRVELRFRVPNDLGGWFSGRMKAPNISITKFSSKANTITISAEPVEVAALGMKRAKAEMLVKELTWTENHGGWSVGDGATASGANSWQPDVFPFIEYYRKLVKDTSIGTNRVWNFMSIGGAGGSYCLDDKSKVLGIVTTNALGYAGESPEFKNGYLDYKVAGLHYEPDGKTPNLGVYDLVMRSETARCLYGWGKAPLSATVSVVNEKGTKTTATTVVSEKNGWLKMAAYGFTFSKKTIKVKITKKKK